MLSRARLLLIFSLCLIVFSTQSITRPKALVHGETEASPRGAGNALILSKGVTPSVTPVATVKLDSGQPSAGPANVFPDCSAIIRFEQVKLEIPAGAVKEPVAIIIERLPKVAGLNPGMDNATAAGGGYRFKPVNTVWSF